MIDGKDTIGAKALEVVHESMKRREANPMSEPDTSADKLRDLLSAVEAGTAIEHDFDLIEYHEIAAWRAYDNGDLNAAKALHDRMVPGWTWLLRGGEESDVTINFPNGGPNKFLANIWGEEGPNEGGTHYSSWSESPARSWLISILKALIAEAQHDTE